MENSKIVLIVAVSAIFAFSYQGADAGGDQFVTITDVGNNECVQIGSWNAATKTCTLNGDNSAYISIESNDITIDGGGNEMNGNCEGNGITVTDKNNVTIKNIRIINYQHGISFTNVDNSKIENVDSDFNCGHGLELREDSNDNEIIDSNFNQNGNDNLIINSSDDNMFTNIEANSSDTDDGIDLESADNNMFNNLKANNNDNGIEMGNSNGNTINGGEIKSNRDEGVKLDDSDNNTISNLIINENDDDGIKLYDSSGNKFNSNTITFNEDEGIDLDEFNTFNSFTKNTVSNNDSTGIELSYVDNDNTFTENTVNNNADEGIELQEHSERNTFTLNTLNSNADSAFDIEGASDNNTFSCNTATNNGGAGFELEEFSDGNKIFKNLVEGNGEGIGLYSDAFDNEITNNNILDNEYQIFDESEGINILSPNYWGDDVPSEDSNPLQSPVDLEDCKISDVPEPVPITEIQCSYDDETNLVGNELGVLNYTIPGTCDIHRGGDIEMKNMTLNVFKEFTPIGPSLPDMMLPGLSTIETRPVMLDTALYLTGSYIYASNDDGSTEILNFLFSSDTSPNHEFMPIDMVGDNPDAGTVEKLQSFPLQPGDNTFIFDLEFSRPIYGLGLFFDVNPTPFVAFEPTIGFLVGYSSADNNPNVSVPVAGTQVTTYDYPTSTLPYSGAASGSFGNAYVMITEFAVENNPGPQGHFTVNLSQLGSQPCSDQTGIFTITFEDESGTIVVNEVGEICHMESTIEFNGTNTSVQGTGEFENIGPQCGNVDAILSNLFNDQTVNNSIRTLTIPSSSATGTVSITQCEVVPRTNSGGDNQWDTRPTFGISHEDRANQVVENGFRFNNNEFMLTDNHHTNFAEQSVDIGTTNSFSATVYADKKLKIQEFLFGIPNVGEAHLAELGVEVWYDRDGNIDDVKVVQKSDVIDAETVSVSHEKVKCLSTDAEAKCDTTTVSMKFLEPLADKVMAIKAIDYALRDQRTFLNEGFDISGESLNPMLAKMIPSNVRNEGLLQVTQVAKYSPYWSTDDGRMFEMNSFGSFKQINQSFERFQDTGNAFTRQHSAFGGILDYEQNRATKVFDATKLISELPDSFGYHFERTERMTDEMKQQILLQQEIAKEILDEMDKQDRHY